MERPVVLTIAGFDPTSGAGITADIKTLEHFNVYGYGVLTANTIQNCDAFIAANWIPFETIEEQLKIVFDEVKPKVIKIGIVESLTVLHKILTYVRSQCPDSFIVWDPIIRSSSGFEIHNQFQKEDLIEVLNSIDLVTPNIPEFDFIEKTVDPKKHCHVYLKGGHGTDWNQIQDVLWMNGEQTKVFSASKIDNVKHGTGCVLSSSISAQLALGQDLTHSCERGFEYMSTFISSNQDELGYH